MNHLAKAQGSLCLFWSKTKLYLYPLLTGTDVSVLNTSKFLWGFFSPQGNLSKANRSSVSDSEVSLMYTILFGLPPISLGLRIAINAYICTARILSGPSVPATAKATSGPLRSAEGVGKCALCVPGTQGVHFLETPRVQGRVCVRRTSSACCCMCG